MILILNLKKINPLLFVKYIKDCKNQSFNIAPEQSSSL